MSLFRLYWRAHAALVLALAGLLTCGGAFAAGDQAPAPAGAGKSPRAAKGAVPIQYPAIATAVPGRVLAEFNGVKVQHGGFGSALAVDPRAAGYFYLLTDRGPNADGVTPDQKVFPVPGFTPQIGRFKLEGDRLKLVRLIEIKNSRGKKITGLPNPGHGNSGEVAVDMQGKELGTDPDGLDTEGLVALKDGSFWISDEYGPWLVHVDAKGTIRERVGPFPGKKVLPKVLALRRANRGMEGLAVTPDGKTLVGMMQSPLDNPDAGIRKTSRLVRIVAYDPRTGASRQYAHLLGAVSLGVSEITAVTATTFLISERDSLTPGDPKSPSKIKHIYKIDISSATDISDAADGSNGKMVNGKTLEQLSEAELTEAGIVPATKELVVDMLALPGGYAHEKAEGLAVISDTMIAVSNDDDFGIIPDGKGGIATKTLPAANGMTDVNRVYFIKLDKPLK